MKVLIAPLNWGIGHATRCIPIIERHLENGDIVHIASSGEAFILLQNKFPDLIFHELPDYNVKYYTRFPVWMSVCLQGFKLLTAIRQENKIVDGLCAKHQYDLIISDNRYGVYNKQIHSVFICHQLSPLSPNQRFQVFIEYIHRFFCRHFNEIWIPDYKTLGDQLSGKLSKTRLNWEPKISFINPLSQLNLLNSHLESCKDRILVLLSGLEPHRSILEKKLLDTLKRTKKTIVFIGGKVSDNKIPDDGIKYYSFLNKKELEEEISRAKYIICRSGYSTVMDLHKCTDKTIIFIPTPGQTEQEYLAEYLSHKFRNMFMIEQSQLTYERLIKYIPDNNKLTGF